jgi:hypothetical protein
METYTLPTGETYPIYRAWTGQPIAIAYGVPYLLYDLLFPRPLDSINHYVPKSREYDAVSLALDDYDFLSPFQIETERRREPGRPPRFRWDDARKIFQAYWRSGKKTQGELAAIHNTTRLTIHQLVHRVTHWYL